MTSGKIRTAAAVVLAGTFALAACGDDNVTPPPGNGGDEAPSAPTGVSPSPSSPISVDVSWSPGDGSESQAVKLVTGGSVFREITGLDASASDVTFRGVDAGNTFGVVVDATNANGTTPSDTAEIDVPETPPFDNLLADPGLPDAAFDVGDMAGPPDVIPASTPSGYTATDPRSLAGDIVEGVHQLETTDYPGAVQPGTALADAWYTGWTVWTVGGADSRPADDKPTVRITADITSDRTFDADSIYELDGIVYVGSDCGETGGPSDPCGVTLTIEPGTTIVGLPDPEISTGERATELAVQRGSRIVADASGQACDPSATFAGGKPAASDVIVFTSATPRGNRDRGDWGGLVLNGQAPVNTGVPSDGEGESGQFGGSDAQDDSGCLRGVRVEYAGDDFTEGDQLNGIAFQGVGAGTLVDFVQIHYNLDDGTEPFGGSVGLKHVVATGIGDDSFDGTDGWQGFLQFGVAQQRGDEADQCMEISNNGENADAGPPSTAVFANVTCVGSGVDLGSGEIHAEGGNSDVGLLQREGSRMSVLNAIITGMGASGFDVEGAPAAGVADERLSGSTNAAETMRFESSILWSNVESGDADANFTDASGDGYTLGENKWFFLSGR